MSRNNPRNSLAGVIMLALITAGVTGITKFFINVNRHGLWKECLISTPIFIGLCYVCTKLCGAKIIPLELSAILIFVFFIMYCVYWSSLFDNSPLNPKSRKIALRTNTTSYSNQQWWWTLNGFQFEEEVARIFMKQGYKAVVTKGTGDGGVDIILTKNGIRTIVQCKHHKNPIGPEPIRALWGCREDFQAQNVILVASSGVTNAGWEFASNKPNFIIYTLDDIIRMSNAT